MRNSKKFFGFIFQSVSVAGFALLAGALLSFNGPNQAKAEDLYAGNPYIPAAEPFPGDYGYNPDTSFNPYNPGIAPIYPAPAPVYPRMPSPKIVTPPPIVTSPPVVAPKTTIVQSPTVVQKPVVVQPQPVPIPIKEKKTVIIPSSPVVPAVPVINVPPKTGADNNALVFGAALTAAYGLVRNRKRLAGLVKKRKR